MAAFRTGRGSLEERDLQRQRKLNRLECWQLQTVLKTFLVPLQTSLFLVCLSLSANIWTQQITTSGVIICTTAFGTLFSMATSLVSLLRPDSPFQTPGSEFVGALCRKFLPVRSSAVASTNPEVIAAAAAMVSLVQWSSKVDVSAIYMGLHSTFAVCRDKPELSVSCVQAMAHFWIQSVNIDLDSLGAPLGGTQLCNSRCISGWTSRFGSIQGG
jgi:hypothetical protein